MPIDFKKIISSYNAKADLASQVAEYNKTYANSATKKNEFVQQIDASLDEWYKEMAATRKNAKMEIKFSRDDNNNFVGQEIKQFSKRTYYHKIYLHEKEIVAFTVINGIDIYVKGKLVKHVNLDNSEAIYYRIIRQDEYVKMISDNIDDPTLMDIYNDVYELHNLDSVAHEFCFHILSKINEYANVSYGYMVPQCVKSPEGIVFELKANKLKFLSFDLQEALKKQVADAYEKILNELVENTCDAINSDFPNEKLFENWIIENVSDTTKYSDHIYFNICLIHNDSCYCDFDKVVSEASYMKAIINDAYDQITIDLPFNWSVRVRDFEYSTPIKNTATVTIPITKEQAEAFKKIRHRDILDQLFPKGQELSEERFAPAINLYKQRLEKLGFEVIGYKYEGSAYITWELALPTK